jgi:site-specific recombinase XerD
MTTIPILASYAQHLTTVGKSAHTVKAYAHDLGGFAQWFTQTTGEPFDPQAIGPRDIAEYRSDQLTRGKKPATVNRRLVALQRFYTWAQKHGQATHNPFEALESFRIKQQQGIAPKWLDEHQQMALLRAVRRGKNVRDLAMIEVMIKTGLRVSELVDLMLSDVELAERGGKVIVREGKGGKYREVPLSKEVRVALETYLQKRQEEGSGRLFLGQRGPLNVPGVQYLVAKYTYQVQLSGVTPHTFRHTFGKNLVDAGVSLEQVAALLGHESLDTVMIYTKPSHGDLEKAVRKAAGEVIDA